MNKYKKMIKYKKWKALSVLLLFYFKNEKIYTFCKLRSYYFQMANNIYSIFSSFCPPKLLCKERYV